MLLLVGATLVGLSASHMAADQVYSEAVVAPSGPSALSPLLSPNNAVAQAVGALADPGLLKMGAGGAPELALASSWKWESGGVRYAFTLPRRGRWSDGQPITTRDVGFTLAVLQSPNFPNPALAAPWTGVSLYATSYWSGAFVLPGPAPNFPTMAELPILPSAQYHDQPALYLRGGQRETSLFPPSAGPFVVNANTAGQVALRRNPDFRPLPVLAGFTIALEPNPAVVAQMLAKGTIDGWLAATSGDLKGLPGGLVEQRMTSYSFVELLLNEGSPPLDSLQVRQAIAAAISRKKLIAAGLGGLGVPQYGPLPASIPWAALGPSAIGRLPSPSRSLEAAGYRKAPPLDAFSKGGKRLSLTLSVPNLEPLPGAAHELAAMLADQGVSVSVRVLAPAAFVSGTLAKERFQLALVGFDNGPGANITSFWGGSSVPGGSLNFSQAPVDPVLIHAADQLAIAASTSARRAAYGEVANRLFAGIPAVFLYTPVAVYVHLATVHVPGVPAYGDPVQRFQDVARWTLGSPAPTVR
ncbi:MAG: ABC transporter substrate-binding protein [Candidatus Dormibacteria bacterium]